jgi:F-box only protein C-terminal region
MFHPFLLILVFRPRIRTNGFYCLRTLYSRAPSNDSFWEEKITQSVEVKFYRHMRFFDDGRMLYSLDTVEPEDMAKNLVLGTVVPKKIFEGKYTLVGKNVHVEVGAEFFGLRAFVNILRFAHFNSLFDFCA